MPALKPPPPQRGARQRQTPILRELLMLARRIAARNVEPEVAARFIRESVYSLDLATRRRRV